MKRHSITLMAGTALLLTLTACSSPGATTCSEYAALDWDERISLEQDLLSSKDLEPRDVGNTTGVRNAINNYCGTSGANVLQGGSEEATRNVSSPIEDAIDWDSSYW